MPILCSIEPQETPFFAPSDPSALTRTFGTMKSEMPLVPSGAPSMRASTRCTMFSVRSCSPPEMKIFVPLILKEPSACFAALVRSNPRSVPQCGSVRFIVPAQRPSTIFGRIGFLLRVGAVGQDRGDRALRQRRIHREGEIGGGLEFVDRDGERGRQALAAIFGRRRDADPAALDQAGISLAETLGRGDAAVVMALAALDIAGTIERGQHLGGELAGLGEHRFQRVGRGVGKTRQIVVAGDLEHVVEEEQDLLDWRCVARHRQFPHPAPPPISGPPEIVLRYPSRLEPTWIGELFDLARRALLARKGGPAGPLRAGVAGPPYPATANPQRADARNPQAPIFPAEFGQFNRFFTLRLKSLSPGQDRAFPSH